MRFFDAEQQQFSKQQFSIPCISIYTFAKYLKFLWNADRNERTVVNFTKKKKKKYFLEI